MLKYVRINCAALPNTYVKEAKTTKPETNSIIFSLMLTSAAIAVSDPAIDISINVTKTDSGIA